MEYKTLKGVNQSILKKILIHPQEFLKAKARQENTRDSTESHFLFGSVVDIMLTGTKDEFDSKYTRVPDDVGVSEAIQKIIDGVYGDASDKTTSLDLLPDSILQHCKYQAYQSNWKDDTRIAKIIEQGSKYFELLKSTEGKQMISESDYARAVNCKMALASDTFTKPYVVLKTDKKSNREFLDKFIIEFTVQGVDIKGELDRVVIDHDEKTIQPIDFKTTGKPITSFSYDFWSYRYDFQAATYTLGLENHSVIKELMEKGYKLLDFLYIVVESNMVNNPMVFLVNRDVCNVGLNGGTLSSGRVLEGFYQALNRYIFAYSTESWNYAQEYYENKVMEIEI